MAKISLPDWSRRDFLRGTSVVAASACFTSPLARVAKILRSDSADNSTISVLGQAYAGLAANYRQHQHDLSYTARELPFSSEQRTVTQFTFTHNGKPGENGTKSGDEVQKEIQAMMHGMDLSTETIASEGYRFEPTVLLYQGRVYTDEWLLKAVQPLCAAVAREQKKVSGDTRIRGIALSLKGKGCFHPQVVIS